MGTWAKSSESARIALLGRIAATAIALVIAACSADPKGTASREQDTTMTMVPVGGAPGPAAGAPPPPTLPPAGGSNALPPNATMDSGVPGSTQPPADAAAEADAVVDAGPTLPTVCADDDAGVIEPVDEDAGPQDCVVVGDVKLQYRASDTNAADNQIKPHFNIVNTGTKSVNLADLTIRYWFADAGTTPLVFWCDYAQIGCGSVHGAFKDSDRTGGNHVLELTFTAGTLAGGAATGEIQARFNHEDWALFNETDDFSFDPTKTIFTDWSKVTLYQRGTLIWGIEPG